MRANRLFRNVAIIASFALFSLTAFSQGTTSRITGVVADTSGAAVAGASVTIKRQGAGNTFTTQTNSNGAYVFDLIQPGAYDLTVEKQASKSLFLPETRP
ncbi:MAG: carboxypeptidase regulatory-like domain-containing protein [Chloracidobacterium sp.]|nr:carboxypeptidase regulatory-like domain-containing protein [Chloracidobacterium sp.]